MKYHLITWQPGPGAPVVSSHPDVKSLQQHLKDLYAQAMGTLVGRATRIYVFKGDQGFIFGERVRHVLFDDGEQVDFGEETKPLSSDAESAYLMAPSHR